MKFLIVTLVLFFSIAAGGKFQQNPKTVTITLSVEHAEIVLKALNELPYKESAPVIQTILTQANQQLQPVAEKKADTTNKKPVTPKKN